MTFKLPDLPYALEALQPHISAETLRYHHGKHHAAYVNKVNDMLKERGESCDDLAELVRSADGALFNNAAQAWNHALYWTSLSPKGGGDPKKGPLADALAESFGSVKDFKERFTRLALSHFGSGWVWLVQNDDGRLAVVDTHDAACPLREGLNPLLVCDVWEHAYYVDRRNDRKAYVEAFWQLVDWTAAEKRMSTAAAAR
ncbi:MAG: superoxide dismutase [Planctomycetes bacterium]|nr:superoxide dismutase [Planctomycetota bacterium]